MSSISLVIDVLDESRPNGIRDRWNYLPNPSGFIAGIVTPQLSDYADMSIYERAVPDPFARVFLFSQAFDTYVSKDINFFKGSVYARIIGEWRGLIAAIALDTANINVREILLDYSDGQKPEHTSNIYEMKGALGNMLHHNRDIWNIRRSDEPKSKTPYLNLISYYGIGVGATCPYTLLFTSASYNLGSLALPWTEKGKDGKTRFRDPLQGELNDRQTLTLYAYTGHLLDNLGNFSDNFPPQVLPRIMGTQRELEKWRGEIKEFAALRGLDLSEASVPPVSLPFTGPYASIFNYSVLMTGSEGDFRETEGEGSFDPLTLLLHTEAKIARIMLPKSFNQNPDKISELPAVVLPADIIGSVGEYAFFALPLSEMGVEKFGKKVEELLGLAIPEEEKRSRLTASFHPDMPVDNLLVKLTIISSHGKRRDYERRYTVGKTPVSLKRDILLWPNFISLQWRRYYLYSDLSVFDSKSGYDIVPFLLAEHGEEGKIMTVVDNNRETLPYRYKIFEATEPFGGVYLYDKEGWNGGALLLRYASQDKKHSGIPMDRRGYTRLEPVTLGLDFGSTNTSISYARQSEAPEGFSFVPQRVSLLSRDSEEGGNPDSESPRRVLFFSGDVRPLESNAVSSILSVHPTVPVAGISREVTGGFPSFSDRLPVEGVTDNRIIINYGEEGIVKQIFNMKWEAGQNEMAHRSAFLKTLMLQTYARLFELGYVPTALRWSYPSSMSTALLNRYRIIFTELSTLTPVVQDTGGQNRDCQPYPLKVSRFVPYISQLNSDILGCGNGNNGEERKRFLPDDPHRIVSYNPRSVFGSETTGDISLSEANAVANHMSGTFGKESGSLYICLDIGGSTTDISALFMLRQGMTMVRQNSVRFAAEMVAMATSFIPGIGRFMKNVSEKFGVFQDRATFPAPSQSSSMAPYLFNRLLENIHPSRLGELYAVIAADCPPLMWVDMFVSGLLVYYAGQTAAKIVDDIRHLSPEETGVMKEVREIKILFAGKGSRIMQWVEALHPAVSEEYYHTLFSAGYHSDKTDAIPAFKIYIPALDASDVKYEVAKGLIRDDTELCNPSDNTPGEIISEDGFGISNERGVLLELSPLNTFTPDMMEHIGDGFEVGSWYSAKLFYDFCNIFYRYSSSLFNMNMPSSVFREGLQTLDPERLIKALPDYQEALEESREKSVPFDFVAPVILLEGKELMESTFFPWLATLEEPEDPTPVIGENFLDENQPEGEQSGKGVESGNDTKINNQLEIKEASEIKEERENERNDRQQMIENEQVMEETAKDEEDGDDVLEKLIPVKIDVSQNIVKKGLFGKKKVTSLNIRFSSPGNPQLKWDSVVYVQDKPLVSSADRQNIVAVFSAGENFPLTLTLPLPLPHCPDAKRLRIYLKPHPDAGIGINNAYETETCVVDI